MRCAGRRRRRDESRRRLSARGGRHRRPWAMVVAVKEAVEGAAKVGHAINVPHQVAGSGISGGFSRVQ